MTQFCGQTVASYWEIALKSQNQKTNFSLSRLSGETRNPVGKKSEIGNQKSEIRNQKSIRDQTGSEIEQRSIRDQRYQRSRSEIRDQRSEIRDQRPEIRDQRSEMRSRSEIRESQRSEIRDQKSEIGNKITSHLRDVGYYVGSTHNALYPTILPCMWGGGRRGGRGGDDRVGELSNRAVLSL